MVLSLKTLKYIKVIIFNYAKGITSIGISKNLTKIAKDKTGVSWYPNKIKPIHLIRVLL